MTEDELNAEIDRELAAEEAKRRAALRIEIASRLRHEEAVRHNRRVNQQHPVELPPSAESCGGLRA